MATGAGGNVEVVPRLYPIARRGSQFARSCRVLRLAREGRRDLMLRAGNRVLFLADKVAQEGGRRVLVEPLTNVWNDVPFQGIAREGGPYIAWFKDPAGNLLSVLQER